MNDVVIDICGTLFRSNTTFDFVKWLRKDSFLYGIFVSIYHTRIWKVFNRLSKKFLKVDVTRKIIISQLRGIKKEQLDDYAKQFYNDYLCKNENIDVYHVIKKFKEENRNLILVSATIYPLAKQVASSLNICEFYATELEYENNVCKGRIKNDLLGRKDKLLIDTTPYACLTDDFSDVELLLKAERQIIITYPNTARRWRKISKKAFRSAEIIYVSNKLSY